jgi:type I restriction enzyme S subunit
MTWDRIRLGNVLQHIPRPVTVEPDVEYREIGIRSHGRGLFHKEAVVGATLGEKKVFWVKPGDFVLNIVFAWEGAVAIVGEAEAGMIGSHRFPTFRADEKRLDPKFLLHYFRTREGLEWLLRVSPGGAGRNRTLSRKAFLNSEVPLPTVAEQKVVVERLERLEARLHKACELRATADGAIDTVWERAAEERFGRLSSQAPIGQLATVQGGGTPSKANPMYWTGNVPWVSPKDMKCWDLLDAEDHISEAATKETAAKIVRSGAVLVVTRGMILARTVPVARLRVDAAINQDMKALHPKPNVNPEYLLFALRAMNRGLLALVAKSTHDTRKLETDKLLSFHVPVAPPDEQVAIVSELKQLRDSLTGAKEHAAAVAKELEVLKRVILSQAFASMRRSVPSSAEARAAAG